MSLELKQRISKQILIKITARDNDSDICGMSYNAAADELFFADYENKVVRSIRLCEPPGDLRDVYRAKNCGEPPIMNSVCHMSCSDTLLVCSHENYNCWLVALSRSGGEWLEADRINTEKQGRMLYALSDSQVLIGAYDSTYLELFRVESGPRIVRVQRICVDIEYKWFCATKTSGSGSDTLVAMSYYCAVRVHRLQDNQLEELARLELDSPNHILWSDDRLLVTEQSQPTTVTELYWDRMRSRLERRCQLIAPEEGIVVSRWCAVEDGLVIFDMMSKDILHYKICMTF